jgi:hypothetical protein
VGAKNKNSFGVLTLFFLVGICLENVAPQEEED